MSIRCKNVIPISGKIISKMGEGNVIKFPFHLPHILKRKQLITNINDGWRVIPIRLKWCNVIPVIGGNIIAIIGGWKIIPIFEKKVWVIEM